MRETPMRLRALLTTILLLTGAALPAVAAAVCGDADGNGHVTVSDGVQALRAAAGLSTRCTNATCDLDDGGSVTVSDGVNVLRAAAGLSVTLRCPSSGPSCTTATVTVSLDVPEPIGAATLTLSYPSAVSLPGTGDAAATRVTILTESSLFANGLPNDHDDHVDFALLTLDGVGDGPVLAVQFDCVGGVPPATSFGCALADAVNPENAAVDGAQCVVEVASE
jgi:hypothetical protein